MIAYAILALGASFLCSILEAVLLTTTTHGHIVAIKEKHAKASETWTKWKEDPERPLTAILTLNLNCCPYRWSTQCRFRG